MLAAAPKTTSGFARADRVRRGVPELNPFETSDVNVYLTGPIQDDSPSRLVRRYTRIRLATNTIEVARLCRFWA
jgi:hypothetical protein